MDCYARYDKQNTCLLQSSYYFYMKSWIVLFDEKRNTQFDAFITI